MSIENDTEYTLKEAAGRIGWAHSTLRDKCTAGAVPHHRRHAVTGIFFTDEDIAEIRALQRRRPSPSAGTRQSSESEDRTRREAKRTGRWSRG